MSYVSENIDDIVYTFDDYTGEVIYPKVKAKKKKAKPKTVDESYIGIDTPFPVHSNIEEELTQICEQLDSFHWRHLEVNYWALLESQVQGLLTSGELNVLYYLCNHVSSWNVVFCNVKDLPCHNKKAYEFLKKLSPWSLRVVENKRGVLKIELSPFLVWKGDAYRRDKHIKEWYDATGKMEIS